MPHIPRSYLLLLVTIVCAGDGCARSRPELAVAVAPCPASRGVILAVDGAGGWTVLSDTLRKEVAEAGLPLCVETFRWQHGWGHILADQCDNAYARTAGERLADEVRASRQGCPNREVYLVAHSAGCQVALAAAEALPPGSVDRIILLAPSVSTAYDLRPALRTSFQGIDVFYSSGDWWYLGVWVGLIGTADRYWCAAAGRVGFQPNLTTPDALLFAKLYQHPWEPDSAWSGNRGGHYGSHEPDHLRAYILPLLTRAPH